MITTSCASTSNTDGSGVVTPANDGVLVRRPEREVAAPGLAAGSVEVTAVFCQQPQEFGASAPAHRVRDVRAFVRVGSRIQQEADMLERVLVVERVRERVRRIRGHAVL